MANSDTVPSQPDPVGVRSGDLLAPGFVLEDRYEVIEVLGSGGSAVVYRVIDRRLSRELALKMLRSDRVSRSEAQRLKREVRITRDVRSEHLVRIYDVGGTDASAYITMELVEGETLATKLRREGALPIDEALRIARDILAALQSLHKMDVVHRDIKPSNILLTPAGQVRLGDLGLARANRRDETAVTNPETLVGTWEYISPEQAVGGSIAPQSDLYSFGVTLFEMLSGKLPFESDSAVGFVTAHLSRKPPKLSSIRPDIPRWLDRIVARLLEKRLDLRYRDAGDVIRDLDRQKATPPPARQRLMIGIVALLVTISLATGWNLWSDSRYDRLVFVEHNVVEARDRLDRVLWTREIGQTGWIVEYLSDGRSRIATFDGPADSPFEELRRLAIIDPQTGIRKREIILPSATTSFGEMTEEFHPAQLDAIDLDHDGNQEVSVTFTHRYWPSFSVLWDPMTDRKAVTLFASGHHRLAGTVDLTGDGLDELIYYGINNRLDWHRGIAAVEPRLDDEIFSSRPASTPDYDWIASIRNGLLWYAVIGSDADLAPPPRIDAAREEIIVNRRNAQPIVLSFDGFSSQWESDLPAGERNAMRRSAYAELIRGNRFASGGLWEPAIEAFGSVTDRAAEAGDPILSRYGERLQLRAMIRSGRIEEAEGLIDDLLARDEQNPQQIHWEVANAFHLHGELRKAVHHYLQGFAERLFGTGRAARDYILGAVLALVELGDLEEAFRVLETYERSDLNSSDRPYIRAWLRHVAGRPQLDEVKWDVWLPYEYRYWHLEIERESVSLNELLSRIDEALQESSGVEPMLLSLRADVLREGGRLEEALESSRGAFQQMVVEIDEDTLIRGHARLIADRHLRIARAAGDTTAEAAAEQFLTRLSES